MLGPAAGAHLHALAHGLDDRAVVPDQEPKSISHEETFPVDLTSLERLRPEIVRLSDAVAARLRHHGYRGRTVQLKVRYRDFTTITRSRTLDAPTSRGTDLVDTAWSLLSRLPVHRGVRLVGVGMANLTREAEQQGTLFDDEGQDDAWDAANEAVDAIRSRFGDAVIGPASLAGRHDTPGTNRWGPTAGGVDRARGG